MWFSLFARRRSSRSTQPAPVRPGVEPLEDRTVPSFLAPVTSRGGGDSLAVADFNRDGLDDVVVSSGPGRLTVSLSNGDGSFRTASTLTGVQASLLSVGVADRNNDGLPDVVAGSFQYQGRPSLPPKGSGSVYPPEYPGTYYSTVWLGHGDGTFAAPTVTSVAWQMTYPLDPIYNPASVTADFNHDGLTDVARLPSASETSRAVYVLLNSGMVTPPSSGHPPFAPGGQIIYEPAVSYNVGSNPVSIAAGDFNGDGWTDLVVVSTNGSSLVVLLNDQHW
jgi:hypothetical protein